MLTNIEKTEEKKIVLTFKVPNSEFLETTYKMYLKTKDQYPVVGMETGMVPKHIIEEQYGESIFYNDTVNFLIDKEFKNMSQTYKKYNLRRENVEKINLLEIGKDKNLIFELIVNF